MKSGLAEFQALLKLGGPTDLVAHRSAGPAEAHFCSGGIERIFLVDVEVPPPFPNIFYGL